MPAQGSGCRTPRLTAGLTRSAWAAKAARAGLGVVGNAHPTRSFGPTAQAVGESGRAVLRPRMRLMLHSSIGRHAIAPSQRLCVVMHLTTHKPFIVSLPTKNTTIRTTTSGACFRGLSSGRRDEPVGKGVGLPRSTR